MAVSVRRGTAEETLALRQLILRPQEFGEEARVPTDDRPGAAHFVAVDDTGDVVGTAVIGPEPPPWEPRAHGAWRLRGMATDERWRGRGVGAAVLAAALEHIAGAGGRLLWCNARLPAVPFYERAGFERVGERWDEPHIGPHIAMQLKMTTGGVSRERTSPLGP